MKFQDYYEVLGLSRGASADEVRKAYRKLALEWHPDRHQGDAKEEAERRFKQVTEAYEVLSDAEKRKRYDRLGENWRHGEEFTPPQGARTMSREEFERAFGGAGGFSDFFTELFGDDLGRRFGGGRRRHPRYRHRGADVRADLSLGVSDVVRGGKSTFRLPAAVSCPLCGGVGFVDDHACPTCGGLGQVRRTQTVEVSIPKEARDGMVLRLEGLGEPGEEGGEAGDLHLTLRVASDAVYRVDGGDVEADLSVTPWEAWFGTRVEVRTPAGTALATVPSGTRAGKRLRLRGQGLARAKDGRGDFLLVVRLVLPEELSERQVELLREMASAGARSVAGGVRQPASGEGGA